MSCSRWSVLWASVLLLPACGDQSSQQPDCTGMDFSADVAAQRDLGGPAQDGRALDLARADSASSDLGQTSDLQLGDGPSTDASLPLDQAPPVPDVSLQPDQALQPDQSSPLPDVNLQPDQATPLPDVILQPDQATPLPDVILQPDQSSPLPDVNLQPDQSSAPPGLSTPCASGPGWTLFRFHYSSNSDSPSIDVWDASCSYSLAPNSACNAVLVTYGFGDVARTAENYPILTTSDYLRVRFSAAGLSFSQAAVYLQARSYSTSASTNYEIWSPLYGSQYGGPVDNDWVYDWYGLDWTGYLTPSDDPNLTAIQLYAAWGSGSLAVKAVELCVQ